MPMFRHTSLEPGMWRGWFDNGASVEINWTRWGFALGLFCHSPDDPHIGCHIHLGLLNMFFPTPWPNKRRTIEEAVEFSGQGGKSWGVSYFDRSVHFNWGHRCKIFDLPVVSWNFQRHEVFRPDGSWAPHVGSWEDKPADGRKEWVFDYTYTLKSGEVQNRTATVYRERYTHTRKWLWRRLPFATRVRESIHYEFDGEVGERTGSWKGGVWASGEELRPGEAVEQAFRRMERERKF